jgi:dTDP-4-amino-4,6-dideoxy-D-galactose acyltransferase
MINELKWDSEFFGKKIGELTLDFESLPQSEAFIGKAKEDGFKYITCKLQSQQANIIRALELFGFHLSDIGVTWAVETEQFIYKNVTTNFEIRKSIAVATDKDIPMLKEIAKSLFGDSRFYSDPFFSKEEADNLYQTWVENSVKGAVADIVFCIPDKGFITCKKSKNNSGEIVLIGIRKDCRGEGFGLSLVEKAIKWFITQSINHVSVRTQLKNLNAMNFYVKLGFRIEGYDIVFGKILQ